jgi:hypothetical protein
MLFDAMQCIAVPFDAGRHGDRPLPMLNPGDTSRFDAGRIAGTVGIAMCRLIGLCKQAIIEDPGRYRLAHRYWYAVLAHQLGHYNSTDARLTLALRRLMITPMYFLSSSLGQLAPGIAMFAARVSGTYTYVASVTTWIINLVLAAAGGGMGLVFLNTLWTWYWSETTRQMFSPPSLDRHSRSLNTWTSIRSLMRPHRFTCRRSLTPSYASMSC